MKEYVSLVCLLPRRAPYPHTLSLSSLLTAHLPTASRSLTETASHPFSSPASFSASHSLSSTTPSTSTLPTKQPASSTPSHIIPPTHAVRRIVFPAICHASVAVLSLFDRVYDVDICFDCGPGRRT
ncbi:hypothetical protein JVT61DRAFT_9751 [Boletus reticuloceps]|uniref:Uncharacterized protein n=1 Tax=Boletus reticuloceps TaxID=495285 RepID=A0A8I2YFZ9_9AGAM|nr:hypothetical protein JVT61DRAFT_9751 [Boletus reticuloceps]